MFTRVVALATAASLFAFAAAAPGPQAAAQCNGGTIQCCNSVQEVDKVDTKTNLIMQLIGVDVSSLTGGIGANCSPLSLAAIGGNSCTSQQVCCEDNKFNGLIALGCSPLNVAL